jgi:hypothetical protein
MSVYLLKNIGTRRQACCLLESAKQNSVLF